MTPANPSTPEVTRADREIAASVLPLIVRDSVLAGEHDVSGECAATVQAFARHRLSRSPARGGDELREALRKLERQATELYRSAAPAGNYGANASGSDRNENAFADRDEAILAARALLASTDMAGAGEGIGYPERLAYEEQILALEMDIERLKKGEQPIYAGLTAREAMGTYHPGDEA